MLTKNLLRYVAGRVWQAVLVVWIAYTFTFIAIALLPSDPITIHLDQISEGTSNIDPNLIEAMKEYYGYNQPLHYQYLHQLSEVLRLNFGYSLSASLPVVVRMGQVAWPTAQLGLMAFAISLAFSAIVVTTATLSRNQFVRQVLRSLPSFFTALPTFWVGLLALHLFSFQLGWISLFPDDSFLSLLIPAAVLAIPLATGVSQVLMSTIDAVYAQPYIAVARAKGADAVHIFVRHAIKNASSPALTMLGLIIGNMVAGATVIETIFARPGLGRVLQQAISTQDVALVQGFVLLASLAFVTVNLLVDLAYPLLDPRVVTPGQRQQDPAGKPASPGPEAAPILPAQALPASNPDPVRRTTP